jgi:hypothetical protein
VATEAHCATTTLGGQLDVPEAGSREWGGAVHPPDTEVLTGPFATRGRWEA